jgi:hypothetical protein
VYVRICDAQRWALVGGSFFFLCLTLLPSVRCAAVLSVSVIAECESGGGVGDSENSQSNRRWTAPLV